MRTILEPTQVPTHPVNRRGTELGLIVLAGVIIGAAYTLSALGRDSNIPANLGAFLAMILGLLVVAHIATRFLAKGANAVMLPLAALLNGVGFVMLNRLNAKRFAGPQATWTLIGVAAYIVTMVAVRRVNDLRRFQWTFFIAGVGLLLMPLVPGVGRSVGGAKIWIEVGPLRFQPGEIAKVLLALFVAGYLAERRELIAAGTWRVGPLNLPEPRFFLPLLAAWGVSVVIMFMQKDLGSALMFFTLFLVVVWVATERASFLAIGVLLFAAGVFIAYKTVATVQNRWNLLVDPWSRYDDVRGGYQIIQAQLAMGSGGLAGSGLGLGSPSKIPAASTDFIFAAVGEELGLFGTTAILMAFLLMIGAGLQTAMRAERTFEKLLATGLTTILGIQAFIIIGGNIRLLPLTGVTLPFVSYGGSSLVANYVLLALMMRIGDSSARRDGELPPEVSLAERRAAKRFATAQRRANPNGRDDTVVVG